MIDIPVGKALVPVEGKGCEDCYFKKFNEECNSICCGVSRKDGKEVIFKLVDINSKYIDGTTR